MAKRQKSKPAVPQRRASDVPPKFAKFGDRIKRLVGDATWEEKVEALVEHYKTKREFKSTLDFATQFDARRAKKDELERQMEELTPHIAAFERIIIERLLDDGTTSCRLSTGVLLTVREELVAKAPDKQALMAYVREHGLDDLLTLNYQTMNSVVKSMHDNGEDIPSCIEVYYRQQLSRRKAS